jgi:antitoxin (DNA-binding transcriptional repressor) of toxin-antitoxin stability system
VLDSVERGETILVTRAGRRVASIAPTPLATGAALNAVLRRWRGAAALDDDFAESIDTARAAASTEDDRDPWTA